MAQFLASYVVTRTIWMRRHNYARPRRLRRRRLMRAPLAQFFTPTLAQAAAAAAFATANFECNECCARNNFES